MEYGKVNSLYANHLHTAKSISDRQENMVYELMKERRRRRSSVSLGTIALTVVGAPSSMSAASNFSEQNQHVNSLKRNESKSSLVKPRTNTNTQQSVVLNSNFPKLQSTHHQHHHNHHHHHHRSHESQRSLSLIYPMNKNKRTNLTVMKLISSIETLSTLCLKEDKFSEANQLVKMHASKKEACKSFEFREIIFYSVYQKTIDDLNKLSRLSKLQNQSQQGNDMVKKQQRQNLIDLSMQSLDMAKITENLLSFVDKDDELLKCIFLCDTITIANVDLKVASNLIDYARIKLNQNLIGNGANASAANANLLLELTKRPNESVPQKAKHNNVDNNNKSSDSDENAKQSTTRTSKRKIKSKYFIN